MKRPRPAPDHQTRERDLRWIAASSSGGAEIRFFATRHSAGHTEELTHAEAVRLAFGLLALGMFLGLREGSEGFNPNSKEVMPAT